MNGGAQAGIEYLMTYGWALVIIASIVGTLAFVTNMPSDYGSFSVSDPNRFTLKGTNITGSFVQMKLQNITGGQVLITKMEANGYEDCKVDSEAVPENGIMIGQGDEFLITCSIIEGGLKTVTLNYTDVFGLSHTITITAMGGVRAIEPSGETICNDGLDNDDDTYVDCADPDCAGETGASGQVCEPGLEVTCNDSMENDGDSLIDCQDPDCDGQEGPAGTGTCEAGAETTCSDGFDNDMDGQVDCADSEDCPNGTACGGSDFICYDEACTEGYVLAPPTGRPSMIVKAGLYILTQNVSDSYEGYVIRANDVTMDCLGHSLTSKGGGSMGIYIDHVSSNVKVKNCKVSNFTYGIYLSYSSNVELSNNTANGNDGHGIRFFRSPNNTATSNKANGNDEGITVYQANGNVFIGNEANGNSTNGISFALSWPYPDATMNNNTICGNGSNDIYCGGGPIYGSGNSATNTWNCLRNLWSDNCP